MTDFSAQAPEAPEFDFFAPDVPDAPVIDRPMSRGRAGGFALEAAAGLALAGCGGGGG